MNSATTESSTISPTVIPQISYASALALEVRDLGGGERLLQREFLAELEQLNKTAPAGTTWRLETPHELFALRSPLTHENANKAHSIDDSIKAGWYWTSEETPWFEGGRVVVGFDLGYVDYDLAGYRAFARAVRVVGQ
ncbi:DUF1566 domain-containing protein [Xanthomonas theicola]|uniref:DUF1566 domain-containing protein n=1 Tax=Xanthomonas theicola TaxID=56464 RepID=A0A2S6ZLT3_9XANT|nr:DUF1566 domain-containing protein [Xanthomonas theicola]PPT93237.1 hypothetical protein XthCFBP4691_01090 [Xanthomonas theicola]QNH24828.1 DUF1566 domain-containing protein [Xanthomonas theicola]